MYDIGFHVRYWIPDLSLSLLLNEMTAYIYGTCQFVGEDWIRRVLPGDDGERGKLKRLALSELSFQLSN